MAGKGNKKQLTLTQALAQFLGKTLLPDLKTRAAEAPVKAALMRQWQAEKTANRTADGFPAWEQRTLEQVGAAWVLSCVFVRTLEDRDLLARRRLAGPGAADSEQLFFEIGPSLTARDYLLTVFKEVGSLPGAEDLLGPRHNPVWRLAPSAEKSRALLDFFRQQDAEGELLWRFGGGDTRFLGDLYQDLSEDVRKRYALLQTPDFVERFILEQTLEPAITEFGLETVRVIDPTCGSGHFLLGAFDRLLSHRQRAAPAVDVRDHALAALGQIYGVDVNPYAVAVARFRLTLEYLQRTGITKLAQAPRLPLNLVVADSLLHGAKHANLLFAEHERAAEDYKAWGAEMFALDDAQAARRVFGQRYHAVVGNPPYITCQDSALREAYRSRYKSATGTYALSAPFTERFFGLATDGGFVGMINASSFAKREFGKALIESVLPFVDLAKVVDTSGAYIPGHGTPTLLLFGRNRRPVASTLVGVLRKRGERSEPSDPARGPAWISVISHHGDVGFENEYVSVEELSRSEFSVHPWITRGGGVRELKTRLEERAASTLGEIAAGSIGRAARTGEDEVFAQPHHVAARGAIPAEQWRELLIGENVRDFSSSEGEKILFPYTETLEAVRPDSEIGVAIQRFLWPWRSHLAKRATFQGDIKAAGLNWYEYMQYTPSANATPLSIAFAFVATHNHFVLDRGGKVFKQSAPIIKLRASATEDEHFALLAYLNSSTACFWMKQVFSPRGGDQIGDGGRLSPTEWEDRYDFAGTGLQSLPLPLLDPQFVSFGRQLNDLAQRRVALGPANILAEATATDIRGALKRSRDEDQRLFDQMVAIQETLDWYTYKTFGLLETLPAPETVLSPGRRPFECMAWAQFSDDDPDREWFRRSRFREPTPEELVGAVAAKIATIQSSKDLTLVENFNYKRRWKAPDYDTELDVAVEAECLGAIESVIQGFRQPVTVRSLIDATAASNRGRTLELLSDRGGDDAVTDVILRQAVPFPLAAIFKESGIEKRAAWRQAWSRQQREDLGESSGEIPVVRGFDQKDYRDPTYWRLRGKLDVPKECFISYPGCEKDEDPSPLIGWAGWTHLQRAEALVALYNDRKDIDGWHRERLMPMLVGLYELMFWLDLWHSKPEARSQNPAREFKQFLDAELHAHHLTAEDLEAWRPPTRKASAKRTLATATGSEKSTDDETATPIRTRRRKTDVATETP